MSQFEYHLPENIQLQVIELLKKDSVRFEVMFSFSKSSEGVILPLLVIADDVPFGQQFYDEFYQLCDKYFDFQKIKSDSEKTKK